MSIGIMLIVSIPQAVWIACNDESGNIRDSDDRFNTASGMDCMQYYWVEFREEEIDVSIPQAVWIACNLTRRRMTFVFISFNTASGMDCMQCSGVH